jgi:hypothetical protein
VQREFLPAGFVCTIEVPLPRGGGLMELSSHSRSRARLDGIRVLVADDEILIALDIEAAFTEARAEVVALCMTLS